MKLHVLCNHLSCGQVKIRLVLCVKNVVADEKYNVSSEVSDLYSLCLVTTAVATEAKRESQDHEACVQAESGIVMSLSDTVYNDCCKGVSEANVMSEPCGMSHIVSGADPKLPSGR